MTDTLTDLRLDRTADEKLTKFVGSRGASHSLVLSRYEHCAQRMSERHGFSLSYTDFEKLCFTIFKSEAAYVDVGTTEGTSLYIVQYRGIDMLVAYSDTAFLLMTILPQSDGRLRAYARGQYQTKGLSDFARRHVEAREEAAAAFEAATVKPFEKLLPVLSPETHPAPPPAVEIKAVEPEAVEPETVERQGVEALPSLFARLNVAIEARAYVDVDYEERIAELEARLTKLRETYEQSSKARRLLNGAQEVAAVTFAQWRDDCLSEDDARQMAGMLLSRVEAQPVPEWDDDEEEAEADDVLRGGSTCSNPVTAGKRPSMTHAEKKIRNEEIVRRFDNGETPAALASEYVLHINSVINFLRTAGRK